MAGKEIFLLTDNPCWCNVVMNSEQREKHDAPISCEKAASLMPIMSHDRRP